MARESHEKSRMPRPEQKMNNKDAKARRFKTPEKIQGTSAKSPGFHITGFQPFGGGARKNNDKQQ